MWFQVIISSIFIALRTYTRYCIIRNIGWDDFLMIVNLVSLIPPNDHTSRPWPI